MKKVLQHGKIWMLAAAVSGLSFLYMQVDASHLEDRQASEGLANQAMDNPDATVRMIDLDLVKGLSIVLFDWIIPGD